MIAYDWETTAMRLGVATAVGLVIGFEREWRGHDAGLRTHALVALSSAMITISGLSLSQDLHARGDDSDPLRVIQGLAQAIGFIAGGLIFVRGGDVRNMTTASSLWMAAAIGIASGIGQYVLVIIASILALMLLVAVGALETMFPKREPVDSTSGDQLKASNRRGAVDVDSQP
jgi:putative Mg2+ transporter-C (MgtC) family protein